MAKQTKSLPGLTSEQLAAKILDSLERAQSGALYQRVEWLNHAREDVKELAERDGASMTAWLLNNRVSAAFSAL